jgi:hypothetical protein
MRDLTQTERESLEALIDACGLQAITECLSEICALKAEHITANYEATSARPWLTAEGALGVASTFMRGI